MGVPQNGGFVMENPIKMDDLRVPLFQETSIWLTTSLMNQCLVNDWDVFHSPTTPVKLADMKVNLSFKPRGLMKGLFGSMMIIDDQGQLAVNHFQSMLFFPSGRVVIGLPKVVQQQSSLGAQHWKAVSV